MTGLLKLLQPLRRQYWRIFKPKTFGVRAIIINPQNEVLLVKHKYQEGWYLPGGKVKRNEPALDALKRELREEVGIDSMEIDRELGKYTNKQEGKDDTIMVYVVQEFHQIPTTHFEIHEQRFYPIESLPSETSRGTRNRLSEYSGKQAVSKDW